MAKSIYPEATFVIQTTNGEWLTTVDVADGAAMILERIRTRKPITTSAGDIYFNLWHVILVREAK